MLSPFFPDISTNHSPRTALARRSLRYRRRPGALLQARRKAPPERGLVQRNI